MGEMAKRLEPTKDIVRELFAKSGNQCAFPGCAHLIIDAEGRFIAQVCHIEAAEEGGQRFRASMTNEERRHVSNLVLMCYEHYVVTNDEEAFTVERMRAIKAEHEAKYTNAAEVIWKAIVDETTVRTTGLATSLRRMNEILDWGLTEDQLRLTFAEFDKVQQRVRQLPKQTLELLLVIVNRAHVPLKAGETTYVPYEEVRIVCNLPRRSMVSHVETLVRYHLVRSDHGEMNQPRIVLSSAESGWVLWNDLKQFCQKTGVDLREILVGLRFNLLD